MVVIEKMNNKGFTLIELLATIVILSLVMGISASGIMGVINQSKARGEKLFVSKLSKSIDDYINLKGSSMVQSGTSWRTARWIGHTPAMLITMAQNTM